MSSRIKEHPILGEPQKAGQAIFLVDETYEPATSRAPMRPIEMRVFAAEAKEDGEDEE